MCDGLRGDGQRQSQKADERDGGEHEAVFAASTAELPADDDLKSVMDEKRQKTGGGKDDAALQKFRFIHARWLWVFVEMVSSEACGEKEQT